MKKVILSFSIFMLFFASVLAQNKDLLKQVSDQMGTYSSIKATFSYTMKNAKSGIDETQNGTVYLKNSKYFLDIAGQKSYCDGTTVWTVISDAKEVQISSLEDLGDDALTPDKLFTGYYSRFKIKSSEEKTYGGKTAYFMELSPNDKNFEFNKVTLIVDKNSLNPKELQLVDKKGSQYAFILKELKTNENLSDDLFRFNTAQHPDFEVIDLR